MPLVTGPFEVKLNALPAYDTRDGSPVTRRSIDKAFHGELDATSVGEMLAAGTAVQGSAGYVAMEQVVGTLQGKRGSFLLQHSATMNRGTPTLSITVVPDSGTDELAGLSGSMNILIAPDKTHTYEFNYAIESR